MNERSGLYRKVEEPTAFYVRQHRHGWCVMIDGRATPLSLHSTPEAALQLAEALARRANARVVHDHLSRTG